MSGSKGGRPRKNEKDKAKPTDRLKCKICGGTFTRNNRSQHNSTRLHKYALGIQNMNKPKMEQSEQKMMTLKEVANHIQKKHNNKKINKIYDSEDELSDKDFSDYSDEEIETGSGIDLFIDTYIARNFGPVRLSNEVVSYLNRNDVYDSDKINFIDQIMEKSGMLKKKKY